MDAFAKIMALLAGARHFLKDDTKPVCALTLLKEVESEVESIKDVFKDIDKELEFLRKRVIFLEGSSAAIVSTPMKLSLESRKYYI